MKVGEKLYYERKKLGLTQEIVCQGICSITYLSKLENNKIEPQNQILKLLCDRLNIDLVNLSNNHDASVFKSIGRIYWNIDSRDLNGVENEIKKLKPLIKTLDNPIFNTAFNIILLDYSLATKNRNLCKNIMLLLKKNDGIHRFLNEKTEYWFLKSLGHYEYLYGDIDKSKTFLYHALEYSLSQQDATLLFHLGLVYAKKMEIVGSIKFTLNALKIYSQKMNFKRVMDCQLLLGIDYNRNGDFDASEQYFIDIINSVNKERDRSLLGKAYHNLGYVYILTKKLKKAIKYLLISLEIKDNEEEKLTTIYLLAYAYKRSNNYVAMANMLKKGREITSIIHSTSFSYKFLILENINKNESLINRNLVNKLENEILPFFLKKDTIIALECMLILANHYEKVHKYKLACQYFKEINKLMYKNKRKELLF